MEFVDHGTRLEARRSAQEQRPGLCTDGAAGTRTLVPWALPAARAHGAGGLRLQLGGAEACRLLGSLLPSPGGFPPSFLLLKALLILEPHGAHPAVGLDGLFRRSLLAVCVLRHQRHGEAAGATLHSAGRDARLHQPVAKGVSVPTMGIGEGCPHHYPTPQGFPLYFLPLLLRIGCVREQRGGLHLSISKKPPHLADFCRDTVSPGALEQAMVLASLRK